MATPVPSLRIARLKGPAGGPSVMSIDALALASAGPSDGLARQWLRARVREYRPALVEAGGEAAAAGEFRQEQALDAARTSG
jgi:hypothetical protein